MAAAHGGQIVASSAVVERLGDGTGVAIRPLGRFALRGLSDPTAIVQLDPEGRPSSFPPLRAEPAS
jgi:class 3 adenylate cyclase